MSKLNERLTLVANLSVVVGIVFLAVEMRQNTQMMRAQIRDSLTEKQMEYLGWVAASPELASAIARSAGFGDQGDRSPAEIWQVQNWVGAQMREWEDSYYQYQQGLFTAEDFEARTYRWRRVISGNTGDVVRGFWNNWREGFSPSFRAEIDRIVAEVEQAQ